MSRTFDTTQKFELLKWYKRLAGTYEDGTTKYDTRHAWYRCVYISPNHTVLKCFDVKLEETNEIIIDINLRHKYEEIPPWIVLTTKELL